MRLVDQDVAHCVLDPLWRATRALAGICLVLLGTVGVVQDAAAGALDARAIRCYTNTGGRAPSGTLYSAYAGNQYLLPAGRSSMPVPSQPTQGQLLFAAEVALPAYSGGAQGAAAPLYACPQGATETFASYRTLIAGTDIYKTSLKGVGFRIYYYVADTASQTAPVTYMNNFASGVLVFPFSSSYLPNARARIEVVATGETISPGTLNTTEISAVTTLAGIGAMTPPANLYSVSMYGNVAFSIPTCNVSNPSALNLTLPDATLSALKAGNAGARKSTTLQVTCSGSSSQSPTMSISGSPVNGYDATLANLDTTAAGAKGVGVRLWVYDTQTGDFRLPTLGLAERNLGTPLGSVPTNIWSYQIGASYQQVSATPTAGAVSAKATLTFTYS